METHDPDKLFDLALEASQANDKQKSIQFIQEAISQAPEDARMRYLLGSLYVDIGLYEQAKSSMRDALEIDPAYSIARFHLGLLELVGGKADVAESTWNGLDCLDENHYLRLFKSGMLKIVQDEIQDGILLIKQGIQHNELNETLNKDMEVVIENVEMSLEGHDE